MDPWWTKFDAKPMESIVNEGCEKFLYKITFERVELVNYSNY
jgi:hypothetical protein